jgi:hypothetical protein
MEHSALRRRLSLLACLTAALSGCASAPLRPPFLGGSEPERRISQEELANELNAFASRFAGLVATAGEQISAASDDPAVRRRTLLWSLRLNPAVQEAAFQPNPRAGYLGALGIAVLMHDYLREGDGRNLFGASQPIAVSVAQTLEADAFAIGARFLTPAELEAVRAEVNTLAERFPIQGTQFSLVRASRAVEEVRSSNTLTNVISMPLAPFRVLQGVDSGTAAIRDFNLTARRFSTVVASIPETLRGEMHLLLLDADELRAVRQGLAAFEGVAASADRASLTLERLPEQVRATLDQELRLLLVELQGTLDRATQALTQARELAGPLHDTATQIRDTSALWREILGARDPLPRDPGDRSFEVREWESAAQAIGTAAAELRLLASELQGLPPSAGLDRLFWRAVALLVVLFALLLVYRVLAARLVARA